MHAVIATIDMSGAPAELKPFLDSYSRSLSTCRGLVSHVWLHDSKNVALFHVFEDEDSARAYLNSGLLSTLTAHPACTGHAFIRRFNVIGAAPGDALAEPALAGLSGLDPSARETSVQF